MGSSLARALAVAIVDRLLCRANFDPAQPRNPLTGEWVDVLDTLRDVLDPEEMDLAEELATNGARVHADGTVTVYHRTSATVAEAIRATGAMVGREDGVFFSTRRTGQAEAFGDHVIELRVPLRLLRLDDVFGNEAHIRIPTDRPGARVDVSKFLVG